MNHAAFLHALVTAPADDLSVIDQDRSDGDPAFANSPNGLVNRRAQKDFVF